ncbi:MAG TPA: hypothetical protein VEQ58_11685 [Polyangiaceae bacterium]|nr:hypothetical protein [Polyangiaceae bacterium]
MVCASAFALSAALVSIGGCDSTAPTTDQATEAAKAGAGITGAGTSAGGQTGSSGAGTTAGRSGASTGGSASTAGSGGTTSTGGVPSSGGTGTVAGNGGMSGAGGTAPKPCVDTEPPPDPDWPDATCESWATETEECKADWFKTYCDVSCGRCVPAGGAGGSGGGPAAVDCSTKGLPNVTGGNGYTTRYWDCCQTHCGQSDGHRCSQDGTSRTGNNQSACSGGQSFACYDEAPKAQNDCLSYGYIAKANPNCGGCYRIQFTGEGQYNANDPGSKLIKGKQMIVKVSNTGGDVATGQFDLMIPGGGVGKFDACSRQWGTSDLGAQYGGFLTDCSGSISAKKDCVREKCMKIPAGQARDGCLWFVDWFNVADNPKFTSQAENCPF